jgi:hypothetical protein
MNNGQRPPTKIDSKLDTKEEQNYISDDDVQKLFEIEDELERMEQLKDDEQDDDFSNAEATAEVLSSVTTTISAEIKSIPKPNDGDIKIILDVGDRTFAEKVRYPTSEQEYDSDMKLVRLLDYCGLNMREITELKGQTVPVRKRSEDTFELAIPENVNSVSMTLFYIWQTLIKYNVYQQKQIGNSYSRDYKLSLWSKSILSAISSVSLYGVSIFSSEVYETLTQDVELLVVGTITYVSFVASISLMILSATIAATIFMSGVSKLLGLIKSKISRFFSF